MYNMYNVLLLPGISTSWPDKIPGLLAGRCTHKKTHVFFVEEFELYFSHPFMKMYKKTKMNLPRWLPES